ncbi:hypothetical protein [Roseibium sp.]|uniref:hypothetical protein n=1 Tax=Roseibium sp. TaxID=1936156 RepID=UPI003A976486
MPRISCSGSTFRSLSASSSYSAIVSAAAPETSRSSGLCSVLFRTADNNTEPVTRVEASEVVASDLI